jgi:hypothetical protein
LFGPLGRAEEIWQASTVLALADLIDRYGDHHFVLPGQDGVVEAGPGPEDRHLFSVIALVRSNTLPQEAFLATALYDHPVNPLGAVTAFAQAETCNPILERMEVEGESPAWPHRLWTRTGMNWQPRLTRTEHILLAAESDPVVRQMITSFGVPLDDIGLIHYVVCH